MKSVGFWMLFSLYLVACSPLPGNIAKTKIKADVYNLSVVKDRGITEVVSANVKWVKVRGALVYGYKESYAYSDGVVSASGYFVIDSRTLSVRQELGRDQMNELLKD